MNNLEAPIYKKTMNYYHRLVKNYIDPNTGKVIFKVFPSVIKLVNWLKNNHQISFPLRTFGKDRDTIAECLTQSGIPMTRKAKMTPEGMILEGGKEELLQGAQILTARDSDNLAVQDDFDY